MEVLWDPQKMGTVGDREVYQGCSAADLGVRLRDSVGGKRDRMYAAAGTCGLWIWGLG